MNGEIYLRISIITVTMNNQNTIHDTINSVYNQTYDDIEYIIVDGKSSDQTINIIEKWLGIFNKSKKRLIYISERDNGMYEAMNKGIGLATGEIVGFLNSDDYFYEKGVINVIVNEFINNEIDCLFGNLVFINPDDKKVVRKWVSNDFIPGLFQKSWTPAHPTFYCKRSVYCKLGLYRTDFKIASDVDLMYRYLELNKVRSKYLNCMMVVMRLGGVSTNGIRSTIVIVKEMKRSFKDNGEKLNIIKYLFYKFMKIKEYL